jgi:hypothetical protein
MRILLDGHSPDMVVDGGGARVLKLTGIGVWADAVSNDSLLAGR